MLPAATGAHFGQLKTLKVWAVQRRRQFPWLAQGRCPHLASPQPTVDFSRSLSDSSLGICTSAQGGFGLPRWRHRVETVGFWSADLHTTFFGEHCPGALFFFFSGFKVAGCFTVAPPDVPQPLATWLDNLWIRNLLPFLVCNFHSDQTFSLICPRDALADRYSRPSLSSRSRRRHSLRNLTLQLWLPAPQLTCDRLPRSSPRHDSSDAYLGEPPLFAALSAPTSQDPRAVLESRYPRPPASILSTSPFGTHDARREDPIKLGFIRRPCQTSRSPKGFRHPACFLVCD
ncbi:hypothetical protein MHUMG1_00486 [Metarhizium humberi]|uniref:Uncharacterized protein n=1 Tax=Metarhizium humberi TaxID=2596975 RepID=A0A9P8SCH5_9HYPO|nr:hypothetical protein MHUMG1_00486 [Metarhizium humberi]